MPKLSANLSLLFCELSTIEERVAAAAEYGFRGVEYMFPYGEEIGARKAQLRALGVEQVLFNLPAGDFASGERGIAVDPGRVEEFRRGVLDAVRIAPELGCKRVNCLVGKALPDLDRATQQSTLVANLRFAADALRPVGVTLLVEPLNRIETPGFSLGTSAEALALLAFVGRPNFQLLYDCYQAQRAEGNVMATVQANLEAIGHIQIADSPARHEPGTGELAYGRILPFFDAIGYRGWVGLEYKPSTTTSESLTWIGSLGVITSDSLVDPYSLENRCV
jgi:hydroxypyruvate isomerase